MRYGVDTSIVLRVLTGKPESLAAVVRTERAQCVGEIVGASGVSPFESCDSRFADTKPGNSKARIP